MTFLVKITLKINLSNNNVGNVGNVQTNILSFQSCIYSAKGKSVDKNI